MDPVAWGALGLSVIGAVVTAAVTLRKAKAETDKSKAEVAKAVRDGVIEEWRGAVAMLRKENDECHAKASARIDRLEKELSSLRTQVTELFTENSKLRGLIVTKETHVESQATQVERLQTEVTLLKESVPVLNIPEGTTVTVPESTMKPKEKEKTP